MAKQIAGSGETERKAAKGSRSPRGAFTGERLQRVATIVRPRAMRTMNDTVIQLNSRTRLGRLIALFREELVQHVGGKPNPGQNAQIALACQYRMRLEMMDWHFAERGDATEADQKCYLAWGNSLSRIIDRLGPAVKVETTKASLNDILRRPDASSAPTLAPTPSQPAGRAGNQPVGANGSGRRVLNSAAKAASG